MLRQVGTRHDGTEPTAFGSAPHGGHSVRLPLSM
ncbi:Uncharacterised protein [Mycobacteroides abscessus subsp. abscessus]|nr:Uncharacterised protein [Mycobacteroides abscessus subsp. abscessus]